MIIQPISSDSGFYSFSVKRDDNSDEHLVNVDLYSMDERGNVVTKPFCDCKGYEIRKQCSHIKSVADYLVANREISGEVARQLVTPVPKIGEGSA